VWRWSWYAEGGGELGVKEKGVRGGLTQEGQLARRGRDVEAHALVPERPVVADVGVPLQHQTVHVECLETGGQGDGAVRLVSCLPLQMNLRFTYALPPPRISTSVSNCSTPLGVEPGNCSKAGFSGCASRSSIHVLSDQILYASLPRSMTGTMATLPVQRTAGFVVWNEMSQSMNCCRREC